MPVLPATYKLWYDQSLLTTSVENQNDKEKCTFGVIYPSISYQVHTWINPYCSVKLMDGRVDKAVAFSKMGINLLNSEVSMNVS